MEFKIKIIACIVLFVTVSCKKVDMRGFFMSYETADERFEQSTIWNDEHPFKEIITDEDNYTIFAMADSHVGTTENLDIFLDEAMRTNAVAAVMAGDLTSGQAEDLITFQQHLPVQDSLTTFQTVGNHDLFFNGWKEYYSLFGSSSFLFTVKTPQYTDLYICLDTGSGTLGSIQLDWLKDILETERPNYRHCIIFTHNNLFRIRHTTSTNPVVEEIRELVELCVIHEIDMIVTGHDHEKNAVVLGNTTHITMDALKDDYEHAGWFKLNIDQDNIAYEFINL